MSLIDCSDFRLLFTKPRIAVELRQALIEPKWQPREVQVQQCVRVLVIERVKRIFALRVHTQDHIMLVLPLLV